MQVVGDLASFSDGAAQQISYNKEGQLTLRGTVQVDGCPGRRSPLKQDSLSERGTLHRPLGLGWSRQVPDMALSKWAANQLEAKQ